MLSFLIFTITVFIINLLPSDGQATRLKYPVISSVTPNFGSVEGGTWITIVGANFASGGLFTNRLIFVGGQICKEVSYYTNSERIVCVAPPCVEPVCADPTWQGSVTVSLSVYVQSVEAVYGTSATFTYSGGYTPQVLAMSNYIRGGAVAHLIGRMSTDSLTSLQIKINGNLADIGDPGELNGAISMWSSSQTLYYKPPMDAGAGFFNLSLESQDDQSRGWKGTGFARFFPKQPAYDNWGYPYLYNWDCSMLGNVFTVALQPVISDISPKIGSIGGNTLVTIRGSGFSKTNDQNVVLIGGQFCDVQNSDHQTITCLTRPHSDFNYLDDIAWDQKSVPSFKHEMRSNTTRNYGSPGWWVNIWNMNDYSQKQMTPNNVRISFGWRQELMYGLYYTVGSSWPQYYNYQSRSYDWLAYASDLTTYLIAPFSGFYRFYMSSDDSAFLYGMDPTPGANHTERLLLATQYSYFGYGYVYTDINKHMTKDIYLNRGQRYRLRARLINTGGADYLQIGLRIAPNMSDKSNFQFNQLSVKSELNLDAMVYNYSLGSLRNSSAFLRHHSLKTIQIVSLQIFYQREVQVIAALFTRRKLSDFLLIS